MGSRSMRVGHGLGAVAPDIDADEQEQPDHVDEMPIPGGEFEAEVLGGAEMAGIGARQANDQEYGSDQHMEAVEAGRHEEGGAVYIAREMESSVNVFPSLHAAEGGPEQDREDQAILQSLPIVLQQCVVRPRHRGAGSEQQ